MAHRGRIVTKIKGLPRGSGRLSTLARYMAERGVDPKREGAGARALFNSTRDDLTHREAEELLTRGRGVALKEDVKHMIVSLRARDYELLGSSKQERDAGMREIARKVVRQIGDAAGVSYLEWYGAIHLNRPHHPHLHLGLGKNVIDRRSGKPIRLEHIPEKLLTRNSAGEDGGKRVTPGGICDLVARELDRRHLARVRFIELTSSREKATTTQLIRAVVPAHELATRRPSSKERIVGEWLRAEWEARTGKRLTETEISAETGGNVAPKVATHAELESLRREVKRIDAGRAEQELPELRAYLSKDELLALLHAESPAVEIKTHYEPPDEWRKRQERNHDARLMGRVMVLTDEQARLQTRVTAIERYGGFHRFAVRDDGHERERKISAQDVNRRASVLAHSAIEERQFRNGDDRRAALEEARQNIINRHRRTLAAHDRARERALIAAEERLAEVDAELLILRPEIARMEERDKASGRAPPIPVLTSDEIEKLQESALARNDMEGFDKLEAIRRHNAAASGEPARDHRQLARLEAHLILAEAEADARRERLTRFDESFHLMRFTVPGRDGEWSLASVAQAVRSAEREYARAGITGLLHPGIRREHAATLEHLASVEESVREQAGARRAQLAEELASAQGKANRLSNISDGAGIESASCAVEPRFTDRELDLLAGHANATRRPELLLTVAAAEQAEVLRVREHDPEKANAKLHTYAARAHARSIIAELEMRHTMRGETAGKERLQHTPLLVRDAEGREVVTTKAEWELRTPGEFIYARLLASRSEKALRDEVNRLFHDARFRLEEETYKAERFRAAASEIAREYEREMANRSVELPAPDFTPAELARLDLYVSSLRPGAERSHYQRLLEEAEGARPRPGMEERAGRSDSMNLSIELAETFTPAEARGRSRTSLEHERWAEHEPDDFAERAALERDAAEHEQASYDFTFYEHVRHEQADDIARQLEAERNRARMGDDGRHVLTPVAAADPMLDEREARHRSTDDGEISR